MRLPHGTFCVAARILHVFNCEVKLKKESFEAMLLLQKCEKLSRLCFVIGNTQIIKFLFKRRIFGKSAEV